MQSRPKPEIKKSIAEKLFDLFAILFTICIIIFLIGKWSSLPETVPTHFNFAGEPDGWGSRWMILLPIIIGIVIWIGLYFIEKIPHKHNYINLTEENAQRQYKNSQLLIHVLKNVMLIFFSYMAFDSVRISLGDKSLFGVWEVPLFLAIVFGSIAYFMYKSYRMR